MIVGIDLGTTHSLVAVWQEGEPRLIPNALGQFLTPSVVSISDTDEILVGLQARERLFTHPQHTAATFKRYMGTDHIVQLGKRSFRPEELAAFVLRSLKADAEAFLGMPVSEAVITVPAYFNDRQRKATRIAGQLAGLTVERLLNEPTAAALAYGLHQRQHDSSFLVFDLGGGTFDVSILELFDGIMEVRATAGDTFLGGEDFVEALMEGFIEHAARPASVSHTARDSQFYRLLRLQAEKAKRDLSLATTTTLSVPRQGSELTWTVSEDDFHELSQPLLTRLVAPVERALRDARIRPAALDDMLLVGGATRMPIVRKLVTRLFERFPNVQLSPDEAIALGAAVQAGLKARDQALREVVLTDVCPYSLGVVVEAKRDAVDVVADPSFVADQHDRLVAAEGEPESVETVWQEETGEQLCGLDGNHDSQSDTTRQEEWYQPEVRTEQEVVNELSQHMLEALRAGHEVEAVAWLTQLLAHPRLVPLEYRWQYEGWLLSSLMQLPVKPPAGFTRVASRFFGWTVPHRTLAPAHRAYLDTLLVTLDLSDQLEALKEEGQGWLSRLYRSRRPLAAWLLTGAYHPLWWTYALLYRGVYAAMREVWAEVKDYGRDHLQAVLEPGTVAWWERWGSTPTEPRVLWGAQALHRLGLVIAYFLLGITALAGVAAWRIWMKGKSLDPSLLKFIGINLGVMLVCYVTICLVAMALLLMPLKSRPTDT